MKRNESWTDFMDRAKKNGVSPSRQENWDREEEEKSIHEQQKGMPTLPLTIYNVLNNDRHVDASAKPFLDKDKAIEYAKKMAKLNSAKFPEDYKEMEVKGWLFCVGYSCEGDSYWVTEHKIEEL